jgi:hypothetical protein
MIQIELTEKRFIKNPKTKTSYILESTETEIIDERKFNLITNDDTCKFFRRLGGSESKQMNYTCLGYKCTKLTSTSPDRQIKKVREFNFTSIQN